MHSKFHEDLGMAKDVTKQVAFQSSTIRNISDHEKFEALYEIDQDL